MTSRANGLGVPGFDRSPEALPHVFGQAFARQPDGRIAPVNLIWPAYWGYVKDDLMAPMDPERVQSMAGSIIAKGIDAPGNDWPALTEEILVQVLERLSAETGEDVVYIAGGQMHRAAPGGGIDSVEHESGRAHTWPIAHGVRPAAQSLGVRGCRDCHVSDSPLFFSTVKVDSPLAFQHRDEVAMIEFMELDEAYVRLSIGAFALRPYLKGLMVLSIFLTTAIVVIYGLRGLGRLTEAFGRDG